MSHTTTLTIDGSAVAINAVTPWPKRLSLRLRGISTLTLERTAREREAVDPYCGKTVSLSIDGNLVFSGDITEADPQPGEKGWQTIYQCRDLRARGDRVPYTDSNTLMDFGTYNYDAEDPDKIDARLGRTIGQIITDALTSDANATALVAHGIGAYVSMGPPAVLPPDTVTDLAALTLIPPQPVRIGGEALLTAIDSFLNAWAPNHAMWVRPDGVIRFIDLRAVTENVIEMDDCDARIVPSGLSRSVSECYQRVVIRGQAWTRPVLLSVAAGTLLEDFAWGTNDNATAKAIWTPNDYLQDADARSMGSCSCTDTTHVVLTSNPGTQTWGSNEWDQTHRQGRLYVWKATGTGIILGDSSRIVANTAKTSGGTSTVTLETPLQAVNYDGYAIYGLSSGASFVWRKYKVADTTLAAALARRFTYPVPYTTASGGAATLTSYPIGSVLWSDSGSPPYNEFPDPIYSIDPSTGIIIFQTPTYSFANNAPPADVRAMVAVNTSFLTATKPASGFDGTSNTVDGLAETLTVTVDGWRDPANQTNMETYAQDVLDSVKDAMIEGSVTIDDMFVPGLTFGLGISLESSSYTTGWEGLNIPAIATDLIWNTRSAATYTMTMQLSNRRAAQSVAAYLAPERRPSDGTLGYADSPMMGGYESTSYAGDGGDGSVVMDDGGDMGFNEPGGSDFGGGDQDFINWNNGRDMRSSRDSTSARDNTPWKDPRSARDDTPSGARSYSDREANKAAMRRDADRPTADLERARGGDDAATVRSRGEAKAADREAQAQSVRDAGKDKASQREIQAQAVRDRGRDKSAETESQAKAVRDQGEAKAAQHQADLEQARMDSKAKADQHQRDLDEARDRGHDAP